MTYLGLFSDILLLAATIGMALYCRLLSRRLRAFNDLDTGMGGSVAALSLQVDQLRGSIEAAHSEAGDRAAQLREGTAAADDRIGRLEMLLAGLEDIEDDVAPTASVTEPSPERPIAMPSFRAVRNGTEGRFAR
ncbi:MAG: hypothetical protein WBA25_00675 [Jannaschia sp.]